VSGGEKQRLACARGILKSPRIFLMDEGTSALDPETEKRVQQNIDNKLKGITTVNIAHRFETIENSDIIFMFEEGKVVESGRYGEMIAKKQYFFKFVQGEKYKSFDKLAEQMLDNLVMRLLHLHRNSK
jgi:ABC-type bacteriocin/lantibiotic exporter with double-glycine peptidase domain